MVKTSISASELLPRGWASQVAGQLRVTAICCVPGIALMAIPCVPGIVLKAIWCVPGVGFVLTMSC